MQPANEPPRIPDYDKRLSRTERGRIRSAIHKIQGVNHKVLSMNLISDGVAEVHCGGGRSLTIFVVKRADDVWVVDSYETSTFA